jgi:SnoaL-like domain
MSSYTTTASDANRQDAPPGTVPADVEHFVAEAARISNATNVEEALAVYAADAVLESVTDGTLLSLHGASELRSGIEVMFAVAKARSIQVRKQLVASTDDTIVNTWQGTVGRRHETRGIEVWKFDADGKVCHQRMYTFLDVRPDVDWVQRLRILLINPRAAFAFLRAQLRAG